MPVCATSGPGGLQLQQMASQADACAGVVLLQSGDVPVSPFNLSLSEGALLSAAVAAVWVTAWCIRALVRAVNVDGEFSGE